MIFFMQLGSNVCRTLWLLGLQKARKRKEEKKDKRKEGREERKERKQEVGRKKEI